MLWDVSSAMPKRMRGFDAGGRGGAFPRPCLCRNQLRRLSLTRAIERARARWHTHARRTAARSRTDAQHSDCRSQFLILRSFFRLRPDPINKSKVPPSTMKLESRTFFYPFFWNLLLLLFYYSKRETCRLIKRRVFSIHRLASKAVFFPSWLPFRVNCRRRTCTRRPFIRGTIDWIWLYHARGHSRPAERDEMQSGWIRHSYVIHPVRAMRKRVGRLDLSSGFSFHFTGRLILQLAWFFLSTFFFPFFFFFLFAYSFLIWWFRSEITRATCSVWFGWRGACF